MMKRNCTFIQTVHSLLKRQASTLSQTTTSLATTANSQSDVKSFKDIPGPRGLHRVPVIGTMLNFKPFTDYTAENLHMLLRQMSQIYGPLFRLQLGTDTVVVADPKDIETVFRNEGKYPTRPNLSLREAYARRSGVKSWDVATLEGEEWNSVRTPLNKLLVKVDSALHYLEPQSLVADDFVQILAQSDKLSPEEMSELFFRFASESIGVVCFNTRLGFLDDRAQQNPQTVEFLEAAKNAFTMLHRSFTGESVAHCLYRNATYRQFEDAINTINRYSRKHILAAKEVLCKQAREGNVVSEEPNLLFSLLANKDLDDIHITQIIESLYSGGTDSTAGSLQALFYNLAQHPEVQEKLHEEIVRVIGPGQPVTRDAFIRLHYLKACVKESFRFLYPISGIMRILPTDLVLSGYRVPAGVKILLGNVITCQEKFSQPDKYIPERWLRSSDGRRPDDLPRTAVLPFGYGPRNCIGRRFAEQEIYLATIKVVQKLKIGLKPESWNAPFVYRIFLQPAVPIKFTFTRRDI